MADTWPPLEPHGLQPPMVCQHQVLSTSAAPASSWHRSLNEPDTGRVGLGSEITTGGSSRTGLGTLISAQAVPASYPGLSSVPFGISAFWFRGRERSTQVSPKLYKGHV